MSKGIREAPGKALIGELAAASGDSQLEGAFGVLPGSTKKHTACSVSMLGMELPWFGADEAVRICCLADGITHAFHMRRCMTAIVDPWWLEVCCRVPRKLV